MMKPSESMIVVWRVTEIQKNSPMREKLTVAEVQDDVDPPPLVGRLKESAETSKIIFH